MSDVAIRTEGLSKAYRIGLAEEEHDTFAGMVFSRLRAPLANLRTLRRMGDLTRDRDAADVLWALRDVDLEVRTGDVVGVIGRNGAGKSTLLKLLSGITRPTEGRAEIHGRVGSLLEVGTGFHPDLTGRENVYLNGTILGMSKGEIDRKFDEIVAFAEVERFIDTPIKRYSSGMAVRLAFSVAAHLEPEILLIDEVLAVGDVAFQKKCLGRMSDIAGEGRTVLFVSHNIGAVEALCTRLMLLEAGRKTHDGDVGDGIAEYLRSHGAQAEVDLGDIPRTRRSFEPVLQSIRVYNDRGEPTTDFALGDDVHFEVVIDPGERTFSAGAVSINLSTRLGQTVTVLRNDVQTPLEVRIDRPRRLRCVLRNLRLVPGEYVVDLSFYDPHVWIDHVAEATSIEIRQRDIYGTGQTSQLKGMGLCLADADWSVEDAD